MPEIYKTQWTYVYQSDTVPIPDFIPEEPEEELSEPGMGEGEGEGLFEGGLSGEGLSLAGLTNRFLEEILKEDEPGGEEEPREKVPDEKEEEEEPQAPPAPIIPEFWEEGDPDRRTTDRRQNPRRIEDSESQEILRRRLKERLSLTRAEFFEEIKDDLQRELQNLLRTVRAEAYRDELVASRKLIQDNLDRIDQGMRQMEQSHRLYMTEFTEELKYMALEIAEGILHKEIREDHQALDVMVLQLVSEIKNASWINVEVSDQVTGLADHLKQLLSKAEQGIPITVNTKAAPPDALRIDTEEGVVDATLSVQLRQLRKAFVEAQEEGEGP